MARNFATSRRGAFSSLFTAGSVPAVLSQLTTTSDTGNPPAPTPQPYLLPPGTYPASQFVSNGVKLQIVAAIPGTVTIRIPDGGYLFDSAEKIHVIHLEGIRFVGGAGTIRLRNTLDNVSAPVTIHRCEFWDYTVCAIGNNSNNYPWLRVSECRFRAAKDAGAIGIAWGGYIDCSIIQANLFSHNQYHLKLGPGLSGTIAIRNNDFIMPSKFERRADIWFVPNDEAGPAGRNSGFASSIEANKFGNELQTPGAPRILVAPEVATGGDRTARGHDPEWRENAYLSGLSIMGNRFAGIHDPAAPILLSYVAGLRYLTWFNNKLDGGRYRRAVEFAAPRPVTEEELKWNVRLSRGDGPSQPVNGFSNVATNSRNLEWPSDR